jgi:hypothetical protein
MCGMDCRKKCDFNVKGKRMQPNVALEICLKKNAPKIDAKKLPLLFSAPKANQIWASLRV